jgi:hypothetical protein
MIREKDLDECVEVIVGAYVLSWVNRCARASHWVTTVARIEFCILSLALRGAALSNEWKRTLFIVGEDHTQPNLPTMGEIRARPRQSPCSQRLGFSKRLFIMAFSIVSAGHLQAQSASTGALSGLTLDSSNAAIPDVKIEITRKETGVKMSASSDEEGRFAFPLLALGSYELQAVKAAFAPLRRDDINISVTETLRIELRLQVATVTQHVDVSSEPQMVQTEDSVLGRVVNETAVTGLPLVTRNFTQIAALSPGIVTGVFNAGELGLGGTALSQISKSNDGIYAHESRGVQGSDRSLRCSLWTLWRCQHQPGYQVRRQFFPRIAFRVLSEQGAERERFLFQPDRPGAGCAPAEPVRIYSRGPDLQGQIVLFRFVSGNSPDERCSRRSGPNRLYGHVVHTAPDG